MKDPVSLAFVSVYLSYSFVVFFSVCSFYHSDEVENEYHFLFSYPFYETIRKKIFLDIHEKYSHFNSLDNTSKILFLFNSVDPFICRSTAAFVFECMTHRMRANTNNFSASLS